MKAGTGASSEAPQSSDGAGGALVQAGPFLILAVGALWLRSRWDEWPARLPVHWNWRGEVDRYIPRSALGASLPILLGVSICLLMPAQLFATPHAASAEVSPAPPVIVVGFLGGFIKHDNLVHSEVQLAERLRKQYPAGVHVDTFESYRGSQ